MSIRIRTVDGIKVALCGFETDPMPDDIYLDDGCHYALAAKFCRDWQDQVVDWEYPEEWKRMDTQKVRDAEKDFEIMVRDD